MAIKNIIFDLGGVFIPLNMEATANSFKKLGAINFDEIYTQKTQRHFFDQFDKGLITADEFRNEIKKFLPEDVTSSQIDEAWNAMLALIPHQKIDFIKNVNAEYNVFLLSNTNNIHVQKFETDHEEHYGENIFEKLFIKAYYSCQMGMRKPDREIFDFVITENKLHPEETIFIDDSLQHVKGALSTGLKAYHLDLSMDTVETLFQKVILSNK